MSFPPLGRSASSTVPPPPSTFLDKLKRLADWKAAVFGLVALGFGLGFYRSSLVGKEEFEAARQEAAAQHAKMSAETQKLKEDAIEQRVDLRWIGAQVTEIARVTGARVVPRPGPQPNP